MPLIHFDSPRALAQYVIESRDYYARLGWDKNSCAVGWFDTQVKLAGDNGAIVYEFAPNGRIVRHPMGAFSKLAEFVDLDCARYIEFHNAGVPR